MAIDPQRMAAIMQRVQLAKQGGGGAPQGMPPGVISAPAPQDAPSGTAGVGVPMKISGAITVTPADAQNAGHPPTQVHIEWTVMMRPIVQGQPGAAPGGPPPGGPPPGGPPPGMAPQGMPPGGMPPR